MKHRNKALSILLTVCLIVGLLPWTSMPVRALDAVSYLYYQDEAAAIAGMASTGSCTAYTVVSSQTAWGVEGETTWYVVSSSTTIADRIVATGDVHLILCNGATLTAGMGIKVETGNSLTIYAQSTGESMGALTATGSGSAGIGSRSDACGRVTINGGVVTAAGDNGSAGIGGGWGCDGGTVKINGGVVTATGDNGSAGIGGGNGGAGGAITINGGVVTATGGNENGKGGAGIGGGKNGAGGTVTINGGVVTATGGDGGAGIGGGNGGAGGAITINGGSVTAKGSGSYGGAGIGGGKNGAGDTITINGGVVNATCGGYAACIGGGYYSDGGTIRLLGGQITAHATDSGQTGVGASDGKSSASITLGWTNSADFIDVSDNYSYSYSGTVTVAEGKRFLATKTKDDGYDGGVISAGSVDYSNMLKIRNARLTPVAGYLVNTNGDAVANKPFYAQGDTVTLTPKAGYSFTAVTATKADGTVEVSVAEGGGSATFTMPGEDVTVEATLAGNAYTVRFNANGGGGTMAPQSFVYGTEQPLALCAFTPPDGKTFDCWATKADGSGTTYANAQSVSTLTTETEITLYARWKTATEWDALQALIDNAASSATVKLTKDYTAVENDKDLIVRKNLTLDLNGHVVDGAGQVKSLLGVTDGAALTIIDSDSNAIHDGLSYTDPIDDTTIVPITGGALVRAGCGLYIECGTATLQGGTIALNSSYGVDVAALGNDQGSFVLDGGTVCGNQRSGIYCNLGPATIKSGTVCGNSDGGLNVASKWTTTMTGGTISGNCGGPGVALYGSASFEMFGGKITGNKASYYSGAGVYMDSTSTKLTMSGGEITGNHATSRYSSTGAGVYATGQFRVSGKVTVSGNTAGENNEPCDVFLSYNPSIPTAPNDHPFLVDGALDPASRIGFAGSYRFGGNYDVLPTLATYGLREENRANALDIFFLNDRLNAAVSDCCLALYDGELYLTKSAYTITFDSDGGSEVTAQAVPQNKLAGGSTIQTYDPAKAVAVKPADPTREGFTFVGWYAGESDTAYDFSTPVTDDLTLTARWYKPVTSVTLNKTTLSLTAGDTATLTATVKPADATDKSVTWSSSDKKVATVDAGGKVTAVAPGTASITVTTTDGNKTATCAVTVTGVVSASVSGTKLTYSLAGVPAGAKVVAAWYNASGKMLGMASASPTKGNSTGTLTVGTGAATYKLMLVDGATFAPLCEAWEKKA